MPGRAAVWAAGGLVEIIRLIPQNRGQGHPLLPQNRGMRPAENVLPTQDLSDESYVSLPRVGTLGASTRGTGISRAAPRNQGVRTGEMLRASPSLSVYLFSRRVFSSAFIRLLPSLFLPLALFCFPLPSVFFRLSAGFILLSSVLSLFSSLLSFLRLPFFSSPLLCFCRLPLSSSFIRGAVSW